MSKAYKHIQRLPGYKSVRSAMVLQEGFPFKDLDVVYMFVYDQYDKILTSEVLLVTEVPTTENDRPEYFIRQVIDDLVCRRETLDSHLLFLYVERPEEEQQYIRVMVDLQYYTMDLDACVVRFYTFEELDATGRPLTMEQKFFFQTVEDDQVETKSFLEFEEYTTHGLDKLKVLWYISTPKEKKLLLAIAACFPLALLLLMLF